MRLDMAEARAIEQLAGELPEFIRMPLPEWAEEVRGVFAWDPDEPDPQYVSEHQLHMRLASRPPLWERLGFESPPQIEVWSADRSCRYDLSSFAERIVVEVKLEGHFDALDQVLRYLAKLRDETGQDWRAHIVVAVSADTARRRATAKHRNVTLWAACEISGDSDELNRLA